MTRPTSPPLSLLLVLSLSLSPSLAHTDSWPKHSMPTLVQPFDLPDQICCVQCGFCTTVLLVSVPCISLSMVVTVRCGLCANLLSVNKMKASFIPARLLASLSHMMRQKKKFLKKKYMLIIRSPWTGFVLQHIQASSDNVEEDTLSSVRIKSLTNVPTEKRQRAPSAYYRFIKEEIRRLKTENPHMAYKEAFSIAAKNWAHFPPIQYERDEEICGQEEEKGTWNSEATEVHVEGNGFRERKAPRHSLRAKTPFE